MKKAHQKKIREIIGQMQCPHDFRCADSGFENLCRVRDHGIDGYFECQVENPMSCRFAMLSGEAYLCQCPLRVYLARKLKK